MSTTANFTIDPHLASIPASGWVALERSTAVHRDPANAGRRFIPLLLGDCVLPDTLRRCKIVDFREESDAAFAAVPTTAQAEKGAMKRSFGLPHGARRASLRRRARQSNATTRRLTVTNLASATMPVAIHQGFIAMKCNDRAPNFFMLNGCQTNMAGIQSRATGTTFAEISKQNFRPIRVVLPPPQLMAAFTAKVAPLYAQITANLHQSRTLATLRDTLLPKLLSGELTPN